MQTNAIVMPHPQRVGKPYTNKVGKRRPFMYSMVKTDEHGWVSPEEYLPLEYDLVHGKTDSGILSVWHTGTKWDGLHYQSGDKIEKWRRTTEELE